MLAQVDRMEHGMSQVIDLARSRAARTPGESLLDQVVSERAAFWKVLADEQQRAMDMQLGNVESPVALDPDDLGAVVDALVGNVFAHTPPGTPFQVRTGVSGTGAPWLEVADEGPGLGGWQQERGRSGGGSTGLGLDIVRKTARAVGGDLEMSDRPRGGAVVRVSFG
jgi:signal transduction histidine kinase